MAGMNFEVIRRAEAMQALTMQHINNEFEVDRKVQDLRDLTYEDFLRDIERGRAGGPKGIEELNTRYSRLLLPLMQQVLQEQQGQPNAGE
jgi:hypothetical protein